MVAKYEEAGTIQLDSLTYRLVRTPSSTDEPYQFQKSYVNQPPWDQGEPKLMSIPQNSWHYGGFKSTTGVPNTSEYGKNTDGRWPGRLLPGPKIHTLTLTSSTDSPIAMFEALGYLFVVTSRYIYRINNSTLVVTTSKDFNGLGLPIDGIIGLNSHGYVSVQQNPGGDALWEVSVIGAPDTWTGITTVTDPMYLAMGINRMFGVSFSTGRLRNISSGLDPLSDANWADSVQIGQTGVGAFSIVPYDRSVMVYKPEGVFGVGEEGFGIPVIKRHVYDATGPIRMTNFDPYVLIPHRRGLYRWQPGQVSKAGLEVEIMNQSAVVGRFWEVTTDGNDIYAILGADSSLGYSSDVYILHGRERRNNEPAFGPFIWDTLAWFANPADGATWTSKTMHATNLNGNPRVFFGYGKNIAYIDLASSGGAPDVNGSGYSFATSGSRYTNRYNFGDWNTKDFTKVAIVGKTLDASNYWIVNYSVDGAAYLDLDVNGVQMKMVADGRHDYTLPVTASGREIQYRLDFVYDGSGTPPEILYFEPMATPRPQQTGIITMTLMLQEGIREDYQIEPDDAATQYGRLETLQRQATAITFVGPSGNSSTVFVDEIQLVEQIPLGDREAGRVVKVVLLQRGDA